MLKKKEVKLLQRKEMKNFSAYLNICSVMVNILCHFTGDSKAKDSLIELLEGKKCLFKSFNK